MATTTPATPQAKSIQKTVAENVKDTLESIVVAFMLAFVFRAFIVEAFVIPTGSMAVTLYGNQLTKTCSTCGYEYALGIAERMSPSTVHPRCPNCDSQYDEFKPSEIAQPDSGDRILVHKWPFDIGGEWLGPHRWDVTVFKDPRDGATNFIKRLVGLPGEVLEVIDGDVYTVPLKALKPELVEKMEMLRLDVYQLGRPDSQGDPFDNHRREELKRTFLRRYSEINEELLPLLKIQRKLPHQTIAQESLWFNVYNHDFLPNDPGTGSGANVRPGWRPADGASGQAWNTSSRELTFSSNSPQLQEIQLAGKEIDDFYAYNIDGIVPSQHQRQPVGDVRLRFVWFPDAGQGGLRLRMNRDDDVFDATINVDGSVKVEGSQPELDSASHRQTIGEVKVDPFAAGQPVSIEFINLDYRIALFIDGREIIASNPEQYGPQLPKLRAMIKESVREVDGTGYVEVKRTSVGLAAQNITCRFRHVAVERDVYYRSQQQAEDGTYDQRRVTAYNPYWRWPGWGTAGLPIMLRPAHRIDGKEFGGEYFMMGDNSPASKDSRLWWEIGPHLQRLKSDYQVGTVPDDQLIGKAFFVYWPAGYRPTWASRIGMIPNFGRMRWIR